MKYKANEMQQEKQAGGESLFQNGMSSQEMVDLREI